MDNNIKTFVLYCILSIERQRH